MSTVRRGVCVYMCVFTCSAVCRTLFQIVPLTSCIRRPPHKPRAPGAPPPSTLQARILTKISLVYLIYWFCLLGKINCFFLFICICYNNYYAKTRGGPHAKYVFIVNVGSDLNVNLSTINYN